jgi:FixJ family two-component response regulator
MTTPDSEATVLIVDDDPAIRRSVSRLIRSAGLSVKAFGSPADFLRHRVPAGPSCVLLDMCLDGMTGLEVQDALRQDDRQVPVIFLTGHGTVPTAATGFKHGAQDFLEKPFRPTELMDAVNRAIERDRSRGSERADREELRRRYDNLTPREREVMSRVVMGLLNKQTAAELGISEKTIKTHRARVMEKMKVESVAALVVVAERIGLAVASTTAVAGPDGGGPWALHTY